MMLVVSLALAVSACFSEFKNFCIFHLLFAYKIVSLESFPIANVEHFYGKYFNLAVIIPSDHSNFYASFYGIFMPGTEIEKYFNQTDWGLWKCQVL